MVIIHTNKTNVSFHWERKKKTLYQKKIVINLKNDKNEK